ncbi:hypothetical protein Ancab_031579 [Ancistrocladus abbreviatus]
MPVNHFTWLGSKGVMDPAWGPKSMSDHQNNDELEREPENEREIDHHHHQQRQQIRGSYFVTHQQQFEREPMFEKPLTPSDVGKLNRLVIPKQHAEKYFPLSQNGVEDSGSGNGGGGEKGLLLSFEDESGKCWQFRYSYWNSSQSYVLTKGWSRYVKEKRLDAGDVVLFERHRSDLDRLFIGWRRRGVVNIVGPPPAQAVVTDAGVVVSAAQRMVSVGGPDSFNSGDCGGGGWTTRVFYNAHAQSYPAHTQLGVALPYQPERLHAAGGVVQNRKTSSSRSGNSKRLRLFGVNLECHLDDEPQSSDGSSFSSQGQTHGAGPAYGNYFDYLAYSHPSSNHQNHNPDQTDMNFPQGVNQMGNRLG